MPPTNESRSRIWSSPDGQYCAFRLDYVTSLAALGVKSDSYLPDLARRHADFLTCLANGNDGRLTYDLRILRNTPTGNSGRLDICLIARAEAVVPVEFEQRAADLQALLRAQFSEFSFSIVPPSDIASLLKPFEVGSLVRVQRRASFEGLDTLAAGPKLASPGFQTSRTAPRTEAAAAGEVLHLYPLLPTHGSLRPLLQALADSGIPIAISVRLQPANLREEEEQFLEGQIAICEKYSQIALAGAPADVSAMRPTLRRQAELLQRYNARLLFGLRDSAALMMIEVASAAGLAHALAELAATSITCPAGGTWRSPTDEVFRYLAGGYELVPDRSPESIEAFGRAEMHATEDSRLPRAAGRLRHLFDSLEASAAFRFPPSEAQDLPGIELRKWRTLESPVALSTSGVLLGFAERNRHRVPVRLADEDRRRHVYVIGQSGTGKTTALRTLMLSDMEAGGGMFIVDPHGDLFADLLGRIPAGRADDVVIIDPTDREYPVGINLLEADSETDAYFLAEEFCGIMARLIMDEYGGAALTEFAGPAFFQHLRMAMLLLMMSSGSDRATLLDLHAFFNERNGWRKWTPLKTDDPVLRRWVDNVLKETDYLAAATGHISLGAYIANKLERFVFDPRLRRIFGQPRSTLDFRELMDGGKIILVNLAKGLITEPSARFLGMVLLTKLIATILGRADQPAQSRRTFTLYVDEFQSLATEGFVTLLSEARKFGVQLVLANQFVAQIENRRIMDAVFGNVATLACFRVGAADAEKLEQYFLPEVGKRDLIGLPNWRAYLSTLLGGAKMQPFTIETIPEAGAFDLESAKALRQLSRARYCGTTQGVKLAP